MKTKLAIIGDFNENLRPHKATNEAIEHALKEFGIDLAADWISTDAIEF